MLSGTSASRSRSGASSTQPGEALREVEVALDHLAVAGAPVGSQRRPDRERAGAPRRLGAQVAEGRLGLLVREVGGGEREDAREQGGVADEGEAAVVGHVQPLVAVRDHRVGALDARGQRRRPRRDAREQPEGAVDVEPGAVLLGQVGQRVDRVEVARVHLAGVADDDRRRAAEVPRARARAPARSILPDRVAGERLHRVAPDPEHGERLERARVDVAAREDGHRRQAGDALRADVAPVLLRPTTAARPRAP